MRDGSEISFLADQPFSERTVDALLEVSSLQAQEKAENLWEWMLKILGADHPASQKNLAMLLDLFSTHLKSDMSDEDVSVLENALTHPRVREILVYCGWWFLKQFFSDRSVFPKKILAELCFFQDCLSDPQAIERHFDLYALAENRSNPQKIKKLDDFLQAEVASGKLSTKQAQDEREQMIFSGAFKK